MGDLSQSIDSIQSQAERSHVLRDLVLEMGGLAHEHMSAFELDAVLDSMLSKGFPQQPSVDMQRWIHTHRKINAFKVSQILGADVAKISSLVPECFAKYHDPKGVECKVCLDRVMCSSKTRSRQNSGVSNDGLVLIKQSYQLKATTPDVVSEVLSHKTGQIARTLASGNKVILTVIDNKLRVLSVDAQNVLQSQEITVMGNKGAAKAKSQVETPEEEELVEGEEVEVEEAEAEAEAEEEAEAEAEAEEEVAAAVPEKVKKAPKPKPVLNKAQAEFQAALDGQPDVAAKQAYSLKTLNGLKVKIDTNSDARVAHMQRVMAIKKHLATATATPAVAVAKKTVAVVKK